MPAIEVSHLTKEYRLGTLQGLKKTLLNTGARLVGKKVPEPPLFKALDDVSFSIEQGEVVGIIGHNGAGKSTVLKMLAKISTPTRGSVKVNGRIAPLIEVGAGFVPNFTGRENVYLNGAILGMSKKEIDKKFDEIVEFAEMAEFIDTPVKRYSSGMQVKLAFAVATSIESEILIVDEVLAVGDLAFQRKCFDRMEDLIKRQGRTVLLVSHNIRQVVRLCTRTILLDHGRVKADGSPNEVAELFYEQSNRRIQANQVAAASASARIRTSGEIELVDINLLDSAGQVIQEIFSGDALQIQVKLAVHRSIQKPEIVIGTHTTDFVYLTAGSTGVFENRPDFEVGIHEVVYRIPSFPLVTGSYCVRLAVFDTNGRLMLAGETLKMFHVAPLPGEANQPPLRSLHLPTTWLVDNQEFSDNPHTDKSSATSIGGERTTHAL
jgi:ABC-type polysaccharide/polyol phosphate transport system ATPase subunit